MTLVVILSLLSLMGVVWSIVLLRHARDWSMRLLAILLGVSPLYQTVVSCADAGIWKSPMTMQWKNVLDLVINGAFLLCLFLLESAVERNRNTEMRLRVMEPPIVLRHVNRP